MSGFFGGRDPFDDPFFSRPFGSSGVFDSKVAKNPSGANKSSGVVIEELDSDDERVLLEDKDNIEDVGNRNKQENKSAGTVPVVEHPDDLSDEESANKSKSMEISQRTDDNKVKGPQTRGISFQRVTYGGINGAYYTASTTRKSGNDGAVLEESRQADTTTGERLIESPEGFMTRIKWRFSYEGLDVEPCERTKTVVEDSDPSSPQESDRNTQVQCDRGWSSWETKEKEGHSVTRKLNVDGKVETMQTLHNLEEDELAGFEKTWKGTADRHLPGWKHGFANTGESSGGGLATWSGWQPFGGAQFSTRDNDAGLRNRSNGDSGGQRPKKKVVNIPIE